MSANDRYTQMTEDILIGETGWEDDELIELVTWYDRKLATAQNEIATREQSPRWYFYVAMSKTVGAASGVVSATGDRTPDEVLREVLANATQSLGANDITITVFNRV